VNISVFGVPTYLSPLMVIIAIIFTLDGYLYINRMYKDSKRRIAIAAIIVAILVIFSVILHEFAHAIVAKMFGIKIVGAGISWWGAYVEPQGDLKDYPPMAGALISLAGPVTNAILASIAALFVYLWPETLVENTVQYLALINFRLAIYNMLPVAGLDGAGFLKGIDRVIGGGTFVYWIMVVPIVIGIFFARGLLDPWIKKL
jgi:Zn-dependent protease